MWPTKDLQTWVVGRASEGIFRASLFCLLVTILVPLPALGDQATALHLLDEVLTHLEAGETDAASSKVEAVLELCEHSGDRRRKAEALLLLGLVKSREEEYRSALEAYEQSVEILDSLDDRLGLLLVLAGRSEAHRKLGQLAAALEGLEQALQLLRVMALSGEPMSPASLRIFAIHHRLPAPFLARMGPSLAVAQPLVLRLLEAMILTRVAAVHRDQQQYDKALSALEQALKLSPPVELLTAPILRDRATTRAALGRWDAAASDLEKSFVMAGRIADRDLQMEILDEMADVDTGRGRPEAALVSYQRLLALTREAGDKRRESVTLNNLGFQYELLGRSRKALRHLEAALALSRELGDRDQETTVRNNLAAVLMGMGRLNEARSYLEQSLTLAEELGDQRQEAVLLTVLGQIHQRQGRNENAWSCFERSLFLARATNDQELEGAALNNMAAVSAAQDRTQQALTYQKRSLAIMRRFGHRQWEGFVLLNIATSYLNLGFLKQAETYALEALAIAQQMADSKLEQRTELRIGLIYFQAAHFQGARQRFEASADASRSPNRGRLLILGNPDGSLPRAEAEAETIARLYGATPWLRWQAQESRIHAGEGEIDVLHLAAHGVYDPQNPLFSRIELAAGGGHDGHLEVHEVFNLDLGGTNLVVLSACNTALGEHTPGDELVGMTRAFLYAGSPAVMTSLWWDGSGNDQPWQHNDTNLEEERRNP